MRQIFEDDSEPVEMASASPVEMAEASPVDAAVPPVAVSEPEPSPRKRKASAYDALKENHLAVFSHSFKEFDPASRRQVCNPFFLYIFF